MRHPAALTALAVAVIALAVLVAGTGASSPTADRRTGPGGAAIPAACRPPHPGTLRLPAIDGRIPVVVHVPPHPGPGAPLVLGLPGVGQSAGDFARYTGYSTLADRRGFFVAYPTASGARPRWNIAGTSAGQPDDVAYLRTVVAAVLRATCASPGHVGVTGVSNGGGMSARLACDAADLITAAAPVAGGYGSLPGCHPSRPVPMLEIHGTDDQVVPYAGKAAAGFGAVSSFLEQWRRLDGCPATPRQQTPGPGVIEVTWGPCRAGSAVVHERITDAEHGWPGAADVDGTRQFSATARTWAFLSAHGS